MVVMWHQDVMSCLVILLSSGAPGIKKLLSILVSCVTAHRHHHPPEIVRTCNTPQDTCTCTYSHTHTHTHTHPHTPLSLSLSHTYTHTHTHTHINPTLSLSHTHTHTHTGTPSLS